MIEDGSKTVDVRVNTGVAAAIRAGDALTLGSQKRYARDIQWFADVGTLLQDIGIGSVSPGHVNMNRVLRLLQYCMFRTWGYIDRLGVLAFELDPDPVLGELIQGVRLNYKQQRFN